jgi:hypothetical protein
LKPTPPQPEFFTRSEAIARVGLTVICTGAHHNHRRYCGIRGTVVEACADTHGDPETSGFVIVWWDRPAGSQHALSDWLDKRGFEKLLVVPTSICPPSLPKRFLLSRYSALQGK